MRLEIFYQITMILFAAIAAAPAYYVAGFKGFIVALTASMVVSSVWFLVAYSRQLGPDFVREFTRTLLLSGAIGASLIATGLLLRPLIDPLAPAWPLRWRAVFEVAVWGPLLLALGGMAFWYAIFSRVERHYLLQKIFS